MIAPSTGMARWRAAIGRVPRRLFGLGLALGLLLAGLGVFTARLFDDRRFDAELARARQSVAKRDFPRVRAWLDALPRDRGAVADVEDLRAVVAHESGRFEDALAAWERIPPDSPYFGRAALARAQTLVGDLGRFADAESLLESALPRTQGPERLALRHALSQLYFWEFRIDTMRKLVRQGWPEWVDRPAELRDLWMIDDATTLIDQVRDAVETAARKAPDDDRVWLARAGVATEIGRYDEARRWLDACRKRRPDDPAVWLSCLRLAQARADLAGVELALEKLPADTLDESALLDLRAWVASVRGASDEEQRALARRILLEPADSSAFERLAVLAYKAGRNEQVTEYRRRKAELDDAKDRYRRRLVDRAPTGGFLELANLAETLHRPFESYGWRMLAGKQGPVPAFVAKKMHALEHRNPEAREPAASSLAERFAALLPGEKTPLKTRTETPAPRAAEPAVVYRDDAESAGLRFVLDNGRSPQRQLPETTAGGVALLDFDGDGWLDVYAVQAGAFPPDPSRPFPGDTLFRNRRDGTFEDVTEKAGIARLARGYGHGVAVGDYDNDGKPDILLTRWRSYILLRNRGDGTFEDATTTANLAGDRDWPTSAAFADLDNDGDLDLYVCHYLTWDAEHPSLCPRPAATGPRPDPDVIYGYCMPHPFVAKPDHLFRNDKGRFVDITDEAGIVDRDGRGLGVVAADFDGDSRVDLFVANDTTANTLFHNLGGMKFEESGLSAGVACNAQGAFQAGMGTACGDLNGDGLPDILVTNFYGESTTFFRNLGRGMFTDESVAIDLAAPSRLRLGFGIALLDANNDGRLDVATANGHVVDDRPNFPYAMPATLFLGGRDGRLVDVTSASGEPFSVPRIGRGLATGDLDNDGRLDFVIVSQKSPLAYFHNETSREAGHFLSLALEGTRSNRDGVGAVVTVTAGSRERRAWRTGGGSFQSASDPRLHFGLGKAERVESIEVRWPSGQVDTFKNLAADRRYRVREGSPNAVAGP